MVRSVFGDIDGEIPNDDVGITWCVVFGDLFSGQNVEGVPCRAGVKEATFPWAKPGGGHVRRLMDSFHAVLSFSHFAGRGRSAQLLFGGGFAPIFSIFLPRF